MTEYNDLPLSSRQVTDAYAWLRDQRDDCEPRLDEQGADRTMHCLRTGDGVWHSPLPVLIERSKAAEFEESVDADDLTDAIADDACVTGADLAEPDDRYSRMAEQLLNVPDMPKAVEYFNSRYYDEVCDEGLDGLDDFVYDSDENANHETDIFEDYDGPDADIDTVDEPERPDGGKEESTSTSARLSEYYWIDTYDPTGNARLSKPSSEPNRLGKVIPHRFFSRWRIRRIREMKSWKSATTAENQCFRHEIGARRIRGDAMLHVD